MGKSQPWDNSPRFLQKLQAMGSVLEYPFFLSKVFTVPSYTALLADCTKGNGYVQYSKDCTAK